jgi:ribosomal protein L19E
VSAGKRKIDNNSSNGKAPKAGKLSGKKGARVEVEYEYEPTESESAKLKAYNF